MHFLTPVENCFITSRFNDPRAYPFAPKRKQLHEGLDYAPALKDRNLEIAVKASNRGKVAFKGFDGRGYGNYVLIRHNARFCSLYAHLEKMSSLVVGDLIEVDDLIGFMGSTGNATGKHLHFTVQDLVAGLDNYVYPKVIDPFPLMVDKFDTVVYNTVIGKLLGESHYEFVGHS